MDPDKAKTTSAERPVLSPRQTALIVASLMLALALAALDATIVGTALPTIVADLGGVSLYSWLIAAYLLTSTTTVPLYGRVADMVGRKPVLLFGIVLFLAGSVLCGLAQSMVQLIIFRAVQGLGAGAIQPIIFTLVGDLFPVEQRARLQGFFSGVWGTASIIGPSLGGLIIAVASWHWVFYINVPIGLAAMLMLAHNYHEHIVRRRHAVDFLGAALLTAGISTLLLALENPSGPVLYLAAAGLLGGFIFVETRTPEPIVPLRLLGKPLIWVGYLVSTLSGAVQFGTTGFIPLFVQGAQGGSPLSVGAVLAPMSIGWPVGSITAGRLILRFGYRPVLLAGLAATVLGTAALQLLQPATPVPLVMLNVALVGLGMGLTSTPVLISIQNAVAWQQRGVATALNQFSRTIGGSLGVALMGAVLNLQAQTRLAGQAPGADPATVVRNLLDPAARVLYAGQLGVLQQALAEALRVVFILPLAFAGFALVLGALAFPAGSVHDHMARRPAAGD